MPDFLGNLVSKELHLAPIMQPRPVSLFEPWRAGGALATMPMFGQALPERYMPALESDTAAQARSNRPYHQAREHVDESQPVRILQRAQPPPMPQQLPVTFPTVLPPAPVVSQPVRREPDVPNETASFSPSDRSVTAQTDGTRAPSNGTRDMERVERAMVEYHQDDHGHSEYTGAGREFENLPIAVLPAASGVTAHVPTDGPSIIEHVVINADLAAGDPVESNWPAHECDARPINALSTAGNDAARPALNAAPIIERIERVVIDRGQAARDPVVPMPTVSAIVEQQPIQHVIVEHERSEQAQVPSSGTVQSTVAVSASRALEISHMTQAHRTPIVEPAVQRVIVEQARSDRVQVTSSDTIRSSDTVPEPHVREISHMTQAHRTPIVEPAVQRVIVEQARSDQAQATSSDTIRSSNTIPESRTSDMRRAIQARVTPIVERIERIREGPDQGHIDRLSTTQPTQPAVHVTIGRIEVRATPPPPTVKRPPPSAAVKSLEEYLRSRSGGR